jgi:hypothetical protein
MQLFTVIDGELFIEHHKDIRINNNFLPVPEQPAEDPKLTAMREMLVELKQDLLLMKLEEYRSQHLQNYKKVLAGIKSIDRDLLKPHKPHYNPPEPENVMTVDRDYIRQTNKMIKHVTDLIKKDEFPKNIQFWNRVDLGKNDFQQSLGFW